MTRPSTQLLAKELTDVEDFPSDSHPGPTRSSHSGLIDIRGLKGWYTPHLKGEVGADREFVLRFTGREPFRWKVAELSPDSLARWECLEEHGAASGTTVTFRVSDVGDDRTAVECDHEGRPESHEALATCNTLWGILMHHLRNHAETEKPEPAFR